MHDLSAVVWGICAALSALAAFRCALAAGRDPDRRGKWLMLTLAMLVGGVAAGLAVGVSLHQYKPDVAIDPAFARSAALLAAVSAGAGRTFRRTRLVGATDAALLVIPLVAVAIYFVAIPGFDHGRSLLTVVFITNVAALVVCAFTTLARRDRGSRRVGWWLLFACASAAAGDGLIAPAAARVFGASTPLPRRARGSRRVGWWLLFACASAAAGDGLIAAAAAHEMPFMAWLTAGLWAVASASIAVAASLHVSAPAQIEPDSLSGRRWMLARVVVPLCAVMAIPAVEVGIWLSGDLTAWNGGYFLLFFLLSIVITVSRQAYLMYENRMALARGRRLSEQVMRRNEELEALTGLATTMPETLEEEPIIQRGLDVMRLAA